MKSLLNLMHLAGVIIWVGGMFFAHVCLRPVAAAQLPPPQRLPLLAAVLGRFFVAVALSIVAILASGLAIMLPVGMGNAPIHWHIMLTLGLVMTGIFAYIYSWLYPRMKQGVAAQDWPSAGAAMNNIRSLVLLNLLLGGTTASIAVLGS